MWRPPRSPARSPIGGARRIDVTLALTLLAGGIVGSAGGVALFTWLRALDQLDLIIGLSYVTLSEHRRRADGRRKRARDHPQPPGQAGRTAPARQPHLVSRAAVEAAVQALEGLCLRHPGAGDRLHHRLHRRDHGHRRRLSAGADADLSDAGADRDGDRHLDGAHLPHHGVGDRAACRDQSPGRCRARADPDGRRRHRRAVRRARRAAHPRRVAAPVARACWSLRSGCALPCQLVLRPDDLYSIRLIGGAP